MRTNKSRSTWVGPGINIQYPWSQLLVSGEKTVETRGYPLPAKYAGKPLAIIETPGPTKPRFKARIIGVITFSHSIQYKTYAEWDADRGRHRVPANDPAFRFRAGKKKYGWVVKEVTRLKTPVVAPSKRGIVFASACSIPANFC